jgi:hypothetical protein
VKQNEQPIKRYDAELGGFGDLQIIERPYGDWVKWEDVEELLDKLRSWEIHHDSFHNDLSSVIHSYDMASPK